MVVDASALVTGLADDSDSGDRVRSRLRGERLTAPALIDVEVVSAWRRRVAGGEMSERRADLAIRDLLDLRLVRVPHPTLLERAWTLRSNLTTYDAVYVALAEALGVPLLTADVRLAGAPGIRCPIEVV